MNLLYNTAIQGYKAAAHLAAHRSPKVKKMILGQQQTMATIRKARKTCAPSGFDLWVHAASLGEFEQARPLIDAYRTKNPHKTIILSFFSPSGFEVRRNYPNVNCVVYLPFDTPGNARNLVESIHPKNVIFVKYEFWGNILSELKRLNIPTYLISAIFRPSQPFFKFYGAQFRKMLGCFKHIFLQDENSKQLLQSIGIDNTSVVGDTRFDRVTDIMHSNISLPTLSKWASDAPTTIIAGSSWPADENHYIPWIKNNPDVRLILAPHEFNAQRLADLLKEFQGRAALWSQLQHQPQIPDDIRVVIIDSFGILSSLYRLGNIAIIGGGFGTGIHNINEAAVYGLPVIFGPNHKKFLEAQHLIECGGAFTYRTTDEITAILDNLTQNPVKLQAASKAASTYISENIGATPKILAHIFPWQPNTLCNSIL